MFGAAKPGLGNFHPILRAMLYTLDCDRLVVLAILVGVAPCLIMWTMMARSFVLMFVADRVRVMRGSPVLPRLLPLIVCFFFRRCVVGVAEHAAVASVVAVSGGLGRVVRASVLAARPVGACPRRVGFPAGVAPATMVSVAVLPVLDVWHYEARFVEFPAEFASDPVDACFRPSGCCGYFGGHCSLFDHVGNDAAFSPADVW